ncbi:MAG: PLP-dependent aminotransferase family protein [Geminicoccaceae bacterium]
MRTRPSSLPLDMLPLDRDGAVPMHRQLYELLRSHILGGHLRAGAPLPATRTLARELGVGRNTVIAAYDSLVAEGYLEARSGSGTTVASLPEPGQARRPADRATSLPPLSARGRFATEAQHHATIPGRMAFHPGYPDIDSFPFATWARLLGRHARRPAEDLFGYHHVGGHPRLCAAIADYLGVSRGVECSPEQVVVVTGTQAALDLCARLLLDEGDTAWIEDPGYAGAWHALRNAGARLQPLPVGPAGWSLDEERAPPRLIFVTPSCQWPLGAVMRMEDRLRLLAFAERHDAWIVEDDYDSEYRLRGRPIPAMQGLARSGRVIYVGTFAKTMFPSLRIGFMVVPASLAAGFRRAVTSTGHFAPLLLQAALADFIDQGFFATHLRRMRRLYAERARRFVELCRARLEPWLSVAEPDAGMQVVARLHPPLDDRTVAAAALARGIDMLALSANYRFAAPEQGLLLGYAGVGGRETEVGLRTLRSVLEQLDQQAGDRKRLHRR